VGTGFIWLDIFQHLFASRDRVVRSMKS